MHGLQPIAAFISCDGPPSPLDAAARRTLGLPGDFAAAMVARGPGGLRALLLEQHGSRPLRDSLAQLAARLASRTPHLLWIAIVSRRESGEVALAAWHASGPRPRISALLVDRARIVDSDAETLCALAASGAEVDVLTHARWVGVLGREAVTRRFYRTLQRIVHVLARHAIGQASDHGRHEVALLYVSRLLFLSFLETKEWLDGDRAFLSRRFDACMDAAGSFQRRVLLPLFFGTLNTPVERRAAGARALGRIPFLNGGLFARSPVERLHRDLAFRDEDFGLLFADLLGRYRFTAREEAGDWSEAAVDPEMLGRAFESLMEAGERRASGAFFTPHELVARVTDDALHATLAQVAGGDAAADVLARRRPGEAAAAALAARIRHIRILDPACGSGAFLVYALERVAQLLVWLGDARPVSHLRHAVLRASIFGVDLNPTAVWLCQLRLWLSVVIESGERAPSRVTPLPNLDRHVRVGDALAGGDFAHAPLGGGAAFRSARDRYARAVGARKRTLATALDRMERARAIEGLDRRIAHVSAARRELLVALRGRDLFGLRPPVTREVRATLVRLRGEVRDSRARRRVLASGGALPFSFGAHFADIAAAGGFDAVVGNPPWVRVHRIAPSARASLRRAFRTYRESAWREGALAAGAGTGFGGQVDLAALFVERALALVRAGGVVGLLVPAKLWRSLAGGGTRRLLAEAHTPLAIVDWSDAPALFDAAVYPSMVLVQRGGSAQYGEATCPSAVLRISVHARRAAATWTMPLRELALDESPGSPWLLLPPAPRRAFDMVRRCGVPLAQTRFGTPLLGVKSGCNQAFVVDTDGTTHESGARLEVERELLRPLVRGETVRPWRCDDHGARIIWTHSAGGAALERLPPGAERWLRPWRRRLSARADAGTARRWWTLFRVASAACDVPRVVWADFGRRPRAAVLHAGDPTVPLNTCYVIRCADLCDAYALAALLNSPLTSAWLDPLAEPARGSYRRFLGWTIALLPVPADWASAQPLLAAAGERGWRGDPPADRELLDLCARAYGVGLASLAPLLEWHGR